VGYHWSKPAALEVLDVLEQFGGSATTDQIFQEIYRRSRRRLVNNSITSLRKWAEEKFGLTGADVVSCKRVGTSEHDKPVFRYTLTREFRRRVAEKRRGANGKPSGPPVQTGLFAEGRHCG